MRRSVYREMTGIVAGCHEKKLKTKMAILEVILSLTHEKKLKTKMAILEVILSLTDCQ